MKKTYLYLFLFMLMPAILVAGPYDDMVKEMTSSKNFDKEATVAILPLDYPDNPPVGEFISEELTKRMVRSGIKVVERRQLDKLIREISLQQTGLFTDSGAAQIGKAAGAKYMVLGSMTSFKKFGYENYGLKVSARLVDVATFNVVTASTVEVDADDKVSAYRNKGVRRAARYPGFLEFLGGFTLYSGEIKNDNLKSDVEFDPGLFLGLRYTTKDKGFFVHGYEFNYQSFAFKDSDDLKIKSFNLNIPLFIRIPLWVYIPALPQFTHIYFGSSLGLGVLRVPYNTGVKEDKTTGFGLNAEAVGGLKFGITENVSFNAEYRYKPGVANPFWYSIDSESHRIRLSDSMVIFALSFAP